MNDETGDNVDANEEERKGPVHEPVMIDTSGAAPQQKPRLHQTQAQLSQQAMYDFYEPIEKAYEWNSARLLEMILGEC